jgi:hypothetical protein
MYEFVSVGVGSLSLPLSLLYANLTGCIRHDTHIHKYSIGDVGQGEHRCYTDALIAVADYETCILYAENLRADVATASHKSVKRALSKLEIRIRQLQPSDLPTDRAAATQGPSEKVARYVDTEMIRQEFG